ncbi:MAG: hypothetical protein HY800_03040 [Ignavibacteriales bacterium]|nr:hypothetical protein [Ignavibacteriales bacterium]
MARKLYYKILDDNYNRITDKQWDDILRLQHWYNSEFIWTAGKLGFRMYAVFPNTNFALDDVSDIEHVIRNRKKELQKSGLNENETIQQLKSEGLIIAQKGGYCDNCIAIKPKQIRIHQGNVIIPIVDEMKQKVTLEMINNRHVFAIVDPAKYDHHPRFSNIVSDFNEMKLDERQSILKDWNWLGYENNYDQHGDDIKGCDLNKKVVKFEILLDESYS